MTDKVQKIKDWISKEQDGLMDAEGNFEYPEHEGAYHILCNLDAYIDSLQEEPVSDDLEEEIDKYIKDNFTIDKEQFDKFHIEEKDYMYSMDKSDILTMVRFFTNLQKEKDTKIIIDVEAVSFANGMAQMKKQIEEPVSEELEESAKHYLYSNILYDDVYVGNPTDKDCIEMFKAGAKWQKEQDYFKIIYPKIITEGTIEQYAQQVAYDMSNDWAIDNPTWNDVQNACKLGAQWQKHQIKKSMDLGEPPYLTSVEQAYYRTLKLLED